MSHGPIPQKAPRPHVRTVLTGAHTRWGLLGQGRQTLGGGCMAGAPTPGARPHTGPEAALRAGPLMATTGARPLNKVEISKHSSELQ